MRSREVKEGITVWQSLGLEVGEWRKGGLEVVLKGGGGRVLVARMAVSKAVAVDRMTAGE